jgi:hypothetical protein
VAVDEINWWAVLTATLLYFALGAAWFTPLFGRAWDRAIGVDRSATEGKFPAAYYVVPLVTAAVCCVVIAFLAAAGPGDPAASVGVGFGVGLAIAAATFTNSLTPHTPKPYQFAAITGSYHVVACVAASVVIGLWV